MDKILIGNKYYLFQDKEYDKIFNDIIISQNYTLKDNKENIISYFENNIVDILNDMLIPINEETDVEEIVKGFKDYLNYLDTL